MSVEVARKVLEHAMAARVFPAAVVDVGSSAGSLWVDALGTLSFAEGAPPPELHTPFDLASLTKVIATVTLVMEAMARGTLRLDEPVSALFEEWRGIDRERVTVRDLVEHASGLPARLVDPPGEGRREFEHDICTAQLEYPARSQSVYSDLGFILVGFALEDRGARSLAEQFGELVTRLHLRPRTCSDIVEGSAGAEESRSLPDVSDLLTFDLPADLRHRAAPTLPLEEDVRRGRVLVGEVHDNYAAALGGRAGHAGLFGSASAVGCFARAVLRAARGSAEVPAPLSPERVAQFTTRSSVPGSSRALGWDTMLPTSSCGTRMSQSAFGHVGFTGTSLWIDPARDRYFVLLTNRACGGGSLDAMRDVRRAFHDALGDM